MSSTYFIWVFHLKSIYMERSSPNRAQLFLGNKYTVCTMGLTVHSSPVSIITFYDRRATDLQTFNSAHTFTSLLIHEHKVLLFFSYVKHVYGSRTGAPGVPPPPPPPSVLFWGGFFFRFCVCVGSSRWREWKW